MKKLLLIAIMAFSMSVTAQKKIDSVEVYHPYTKLKLETIKVPSKFIKSLDSLDRVYKTGEFIINKYYNDNSIKRCLVTRPKELVI